MCSFQEALPYIALAVIGPAEWHTLLIDKVRGWLASDESPDNGGKDTSGPA